MVNFDVVGRLLFLALGNDVVVWGTPSNRENASSGGWGTSIHTKQVPNQIEHKSSE